MWNMKEAGAAIDSSATRLFKLISDWIVKLLVPLSIIALMMGVAKVFVDLWHVYKSPDITGGFDTVVTDILSMFVVIELLKSIVEYFEAHRLKITFILDAAVVFLVREVMIGLYNHKLDGGLLAAIAALLLVLGIFRVAAIKFSPEVSHAPVPPAA
jgi:uncharacterized membrane protein (DUF373 family)